MEYRKLGRTDLKVSVICLGTMTWGQQNTLEEGAAQMDYAVGEGVNFFDTAEMYAVPPTEKSYGKTEEIIGAWFKKSGRRNDVILATKLAGPAPGMPWVRGGKVALDKSAVDEAVEKSLKRLQTDYIDLYQIHWPQRPVNSFGKLGYDQENVTGRESDEILETLTALGAQVKAGKIRHIGLSNETPWGVMTWLKHHAANDLPRVASIQNPYNFLNRSFEVGLAEIALQEQVGLLAYAPLGAGTLSGKYLDGQVPKGSRWDIDARVSRYKRPKLDEAVRAYHAVAAKHNLSPTQMAIAFCNRQPFLTSTIIGATSMEQLKSNIAAKDIALNDDVVADINAVHAVISNPCP
ncbi:MAG TPA: NADP(H)-dependent aldo-keto reductase [Patescibacteria group bacterium]|nr:NADP(H)-dependent aldo-keto reductase [Patescibacteria group bacterium]